jgi:hypothetical protein
MVITRRVFSEKLLAYLNHELPLEALVDWAENTFIDAVLEPDEDIDLLNDILMYLAAADTAQEASDTATSEHVDSTNVDDAQWDVDSAQNSVDTDQDMLDMDDEYSFDSAADETSLAEDQKTLAAAKTALKTAKKAAAKAQAKATARAKARQKAQAKAVAAQDKAQQDLNTANSDQVDLEATLSSAQNAKIAADTGRAVALALWSHAHGQAVDAVMARNALRSSCRRTAGSTLAVSGVLALVAVLLAAGNVVAIRRARSRSF